MREPKLADYLDLVALGTVADLVPLDANNRILVAQGLKRMRAGRCAPGILALAKLGRRDPARLIAADLGFAVAPRLNAAGRLDDMSLGIECLLTDDLDTALAFATRLDALNRERREIEARMRDEALAAVAAMRLDERLAELPFGLCLFEKSWHQGVVGLVAARIKERVHRPVIAFARADEKTLKGSARSVPGLHIRDALEAVHAAHPSLIDKFGGHAMAAGLSLPESHYSAFSAAFDMEVRRWLKREDLAGSVYTDGELAAEECSLELAELLRTAGPWGQTFPEPLFDGEFSVLARRIVGNGHLKLMLNAHGGGQPLDAIAFNYGDASPPEEGTRVRAVYRPEINEYGGKRRLQLIVQYLEPV
jgi:single-stranded-DNA-specific exonuclease